MRKTFLLFFAILSLFAKSQTRWGVKAGVTINNQNSFAGAEKRSVMNGQAGVIGMIAINRSFTWHPSLGYYPKGTQIDNLTFEDQLGNPIGTGNLTFRFNYIEFASPFQYLVIDLQLKLFLGLGPYFAYAISGKEIWKNVSGTASSEPRKRNIPFGSNGYKRSDAGYVFMMSSVIKNKWMCSVNYEAGFSNIYNSSQNKAHNFSGGITFGYFIK